MPACHFWMQLRENSFFLLGTVIPKSCTKLEEKISKTFHWILFIIKLVAGKHSLTIHVATLTELAIYTQHKFPFALHPGNWHESKSCLTLWTSTTTKYDTRDLEIETIAILFILDSLLGLVNNYLYRLCPWIILDSIHISIKKHSKKTDINCILLQNNIPFTLPHWWVVNDGPLNPDYLEWRLADAWNQIRIINTLVI